MSPGSLRKSPCGGTSGALVEWPKLHPPQGLLPCLLLSQETLMALEDLRHITPNKVMSLG